MFSVLVTSTRGKTGRHVAAQLAAVTAVDVRGASSRPDAVDIGGVRPARLDWADATSVEAALDDVDALYLPRPEIEDAPDRIAAALAPARRLQHVVLLSEMGAESARRDTWIARVEQAVRDHAKSWTILRPTWFSQILTDDRFYLGAIRDERILQLPSAGAPVSFIDARDIAAVAVAALLDRSHAGHEYPLSGPHALRLNQITRMLSHAIGADVRYVDSSIERACQAVSAWTDPWYLEELRGVYERLCAGVYGSVSSVVERVTGQRPRTLESFIDEHAHMWRSAAPSRRPSQRSRLSRESCSTDAQSSS